MSGLLDDLARALARPVPRRTALRMLGGALATAAVPSAFRPAPARALPALGRFSTACNPSCGGSYPVKCVCPAEGGCYIGGCGEPGSTCCCFEESNAGIPGAVVCPPGYACGGGKGKPNCICKTPCEGDCCKKDETCVRGQGCRPKTCGPDITSALGDAIARTKAEFAGWSSAARAVACDSLLSAVGAIGWEINQLGPGGREQGVKNFQPACATCGGSLSVQVGNDCHYAGSVNYVIYGVMLRLCRDDLPFGKSFFSEDAMAGYITLWKGLRKAPNLTASLAWAKAGYNGWPSGSTPGPELPTCAKCPKQFTSRLTVRWLPLARNI